MPLIWQARLFTLADIDRHRALELRLASLLQAEDAALTLSGAHATFGLLKALRGPPGSTRATPVYADRLSWTHASLRHDLGTRARRTEPPSRPPALIDAP